MVVCNGWLWCVDLFGSYNVFMLICGCSLIFFVFNCRFYVVEVVFVLEYLYCKGEWNWIFKLFFFLDFMYDYLVFFFVFLICFCEFFYFRSNLLWFEIREYFGDREWIYIVYWFWFFFYYNILSVGLFYILIFNFINIFMMFNV